MKYCNNCGAQIKDEAVFCGKCGARQPDIAASQAGGEHVRSEGSGQTMILGHTEQFARPEENQVRMDVFEQTMVLGGQASQNGRQFTAYQAGAEQSQYQPGAGQPQRQTSGEQSQYQPYGQQYDWNSQPQYGQPQYGQPQYDQPQYGQPQYGQSQYGQPQYDQPQYDQPQAQNKHTKSPKAKKTRENSSSGKKHSVILPITIIAAAVSLIAVAVIVCALVIPDKINQLFSGGCAGNASEAQSSATAATGIMLNASRKTLSPAETFILEALALPAGTDMTEVTWYSTDESIATVTDGSVTAVTGGSANIVAADKYGNAAGCRITVGDTSSSSNLAGLGDISTRIVSVSGTKPNKNAILLSEDDESADGEPQIPELPKSISASGYIMNNGYIITTSNVADGQENLVVTMPDGTSASARLIANDVSSNVAILEIVGHVNLPAGVSSTGSADTDGSGTGNTDAAENNTGTGSSQPVTADTGFTKADTAPAEGDTLYIISSEDAYQDDPAVSEVTYIESIEQDGHTVFVVESEDQSAPGGIVTDTNGNVIGISMISIPYSREDSSARFTNLVLPADDVEKIVADQIESVNSGENAIETVSEEGRENVYLDTAETQYGVDSNELARQYDSNIWMSAKATSDAGFTFSIDQRESELIRLKFSSAADSDEAADGDETADGDSSAAGTESGDTADGSSPEAVVYTFGSAERSEAIAYTTAGEYHYTMNRHSLNAGESGEILLYFEGLEGEIEKIIISNTSGEGGVLEMVFTEDTAQPVPAAEAPAEETAPEETTTEAVKEDSPRVKAAKAYLDKLRSLEADYRYLEDMQTQSQDIPNQVKFADITSDGIEEMCYISVVEENGNVGLYPESFDYDHILYWNVSTVDSSWNSIDIISETDSWTGPHNERWGVHATSIVGRYTYYAIPGDEHIYKLKVNNVSGASTGIYEYEYDKDSHDLLLIAYQSFFRQEPTDEDYSDESLDVEGREMSSNGMALGTGEDVGAVGLFEDANIFTYDDAVTYLENIINSES